MFSIATCGNDSCRKQVMSNEAKTAKAVQGGKVVKVLVCSTKCGKALRHK